jgi:hypothetical protein
MSYWKRLLLRHEHNTSESFEYIRKLARNVTGAQIKRIKII